jgi:hypothetical protein
LRPPFMTQRTRPRLTSATARGRSGRD